MKRSLITKTLVYMLLVTLVVNAADIVITITVDDVATKATQNVQDFSDATGWTATIDDPNSADPAVTIPNPLTRRQWVAKKLGEHFREVIKGFRAAKVSEKARLKEIADTETDVIIK